MHYRGASDTMDVDESVRPLPEGLPEMPPGPELAALLESIDHGTVDPEEMDVLLAARARQIWHLQAEQMVDMYLTGQWVRQQIGLSEPPKLARRHVQEFVGGGCGVRPGGRSSSWIWPSGC